MRKRVRIALAVLLVLVGGVIAWQVLRLREPVYQGKTLNTWLQEYDAADNQFPVSRGGTARGFFAHNAPSLLAHRVNDEGARPAGRPRLIGRGNDRYQSGR